MSYLNEAAVIEPTVEQRRYMESLIGHEVSVRVKGKVAAVGSKAYILEIEQWAGERVRVSLPVYSALVAPQEDGAEGTR